MRTSGAMPHASACMIWARPISSPSAVTPLLSAMFWLLKGATRRPSCESTRHSPAASRAFSLRVRTATRHQKRDSTENESHVRTKTPCLYRRSGMSFAGVRTKRKFASDGTTESPSEESSWESHARSPANTSRVRETYSTSSRAAMPAASATEETGHACPARRIPSMSWAFPLIRYPNRNPAIP